MGPVVYAPEQERTSEKARLSVCESERETMTMYILTDFSPGVCRLLAQANAATGCGVTQRKSSTGRERTRNAASCQRLSQTAQYWRLQSRWRNPAACEFSPSFPSLSVKWKSVRAQKEEGVEPTPREKQRHDYVQRRIKKNIRFSSRVRHCRKCKKSENREPLPNNF